ncbi:MAG: hydantoinase/oxoprolinase family protein [Desulfohalobiaceae bacterium]
MSRAESIKSAKAGIDFGSDTEGGDYVLGIDTGGTYTDGVLLDYRSRQVLASAKTLTTYEDLTKGISTVLRDLCIEATARVKLAGISSTLATNSIAQGRIKAVGLLLLGYDQDLLASYGLESKFATRNFSYFQGGHNAQGEEKSPPDLEGIRQWVRDNKDHLEALAISSYFSPLNPDHEESVLRVLQEETDIPVVLGHQLSTQLDSVKRAATASLNASLVAVMQEFIQAVKSSMKELGFNAPLMIVKGDGSLMPYTEAVKKPVETVLSGPSASTIGGRFLSSCSSALVVDVGGTTTDMALIEDGAIAVSDQGARVGNIETAVKAARIRTVCIGCDSRIRVSSADKYQVGPERIVPISRLALKHPEVGEEIVATAQRRRSGESQARMEYLYLARDIEAAMQEIEDEPKKQALVELLAQGPCNLHTALSKLEVNHSVQLPIQELVDRGLIGYSALTPTDLLHFKGELDIGDERAASQALKFVSGVHGARAKDLADRILGHIVDQMSREAAIFLARQSVPGLPEEVDGQWGEWLVSQGLNPENAHLAVSIGSRYPLIGIGAPAEIFVSRMADKFHARFELPPHPHVANAVGAVAGSVVVDKEALVFVQESEEGRAYMVQFEAETTSFMELDEARRYARRAVSRAAREAAEDAGAEDPQLRTEEKVEGALQRIQARAVGNPRLSEVFG